jgi:trehalose-6-phosphate synthase
MSHTALEFLQRLRAHVGDRILVIRAERIDPIKGFIEGIAAFEALLSRRPDLADRVRLFAVLQPSRLDIPFYQALTELLHSRVTDLAVRFGMREWNGIVCDETGRSRLFDRPWPPVVLYEAPKPFAEVLAAMAAADLGFFNSLADGMNLAVKEFLLINDPSVITALRLRLAELYGPAAVAVASGTALISEQIGAGREISEHALILRDPRDVAATSRLLENAIDRLLRDRCGNADIARAGAQRVRSHTIDDWMEQVLATFPSIERFELVGPA